MKYALIFRSLCINGTYYFQALEKVKGTFTSDDKFISTTSSKFKDKNIPFISKQEPFGYIEITEDEFINFPDNNSLFLKLEEDNLVSIDDFTEQANVMLEFKKVFNDFSLVPDFSIDDRINVVRKNLKNKLLGQDLAINKILNKIYNNQMFIETDFDTNEIRNHKSNILIVGPYGSGKSTIKNVLKKDLEPIPVIEYSLTGDYSIDISNLINKLLFKSEGNKYLAERGIVIFDGINFESVNEEGNTLDSLKDILESQIVYGTKQEENETKLINFDFSLVTFICIVDMEYDCDPLKFAIYDNTYYSKIDGNRLLELGFTVNMLTDLFGNEVIYTNEITNSLAYKILKDKDKSPLYREKKVLESHGKKVRISKDFVDYLISYGFDLNEGMTGIIKTLNVLLEKKDLTAKQITFSEKDFKNLMISTAIPESEDAIVKTSDETDEDNFKDILQIDLEKRTINNLSVLDTVNLMKKTIKGQDKQLFYFVNAFFNHIFNQKLGYTKQQLRELKENVLLFGPAGSGKTTILETLANIFKIPYVREDVTDYSKAGYVGEDVSSMLLHLINAANGDVKKAEHGILFLDEFDKIATGNSEKVDSMAQGVQNALLTIIEGRTRNISKKSEFMDSEIEFDTSNLFIAASGAYENLDKIVKARLARKFGLNKVGFKSERPVELDLTPTDDDLYEYGHDKQMLGRLPNKIMLSNLNTDALYDIINNSEGGFVHLKLEKYKSSGIKIVLSEEFKRALAKKAFEKKTGARGLKSVFADLTKEIDYNIQNGDIGEVILDEKSLDNPNNIQYIKRKK